MEFFRVLLEQNQLMALFLVVAVGYAFGNVNIRGFSLGVGAVLFVGLAIGAISPKAAPPPLVGSLGLVMFLYGIGIQFGKNFFAGLTSAAGRRFNLLALAALVVTTGIAWAAMRLFDLPIAYIAGMFAGSGTSTPTLQAAMEAVGNNNPAVGYSVAYPFGVIVPILCMYIAVMLVKPQIEAPSGTGLDLSEATVHSPEVIGKTLAELGAMLPPGVQAIAIRRQNVNRVPRPDIVIEKDDIIGIVSNDKDSLELALKLLGEATSGGIVGDRKHLDYVRLFASKPTVVGCRLSDLKIPGGVEYSVLHVRRGDADLLPAPDLILEFGDRVGMLLDRANLPLFRKHFGDSIKGTTEFSYISIGVGMVLGVILGLISIPIPGVGSLKLGLAGGTLLLSLVLGKLGRTRWMVWTMPVSANMTLRNFGLTIFLAQVGMTSGEKFVTTIQQTGFLFLGISIAIVLGIVLTTLICGHLMRIPFDDLLGITAGVTGNPAILAYAGKQVPTDRPDIGYAVIYPGTTIVKIIIVQLLIAFGGK
jgi:putative transport protein